MTEREEFELVAKAAGYEYEWKDYYSFGGGPHIRDSIWFPWNPKTDDGDCLRLQVDLGIDVLIHEQYTKAGWRDFDTLQIFTDHPDKYAAVRAAVWDVAVEVAKRRMEK
jgi:hypothetical protein